jgi:hypothetical protein
MKESRFIELLNLYVDQELSPAEAVELEAEIAAKPARRRTYEQYCRMQRGCAMLFEKVRANAPDYSELSRDGAAVERKVLDFPIDRPVRRRSALASLATFTAWGGGLAAAAAVVAVVLLREPAHPGGAVASQATPATIASVDVPAAAAEETMTARVEARRPSHYQLAAQFSPRQSEATNAFVSGEQASFEWMNSVQLSAVPQVSTDDLRFSSERVSRTHATSLLKIHSTPYTPGEAFNAFEFRR